MKKFNSIVVCLLLISFVLSACGKGTSSLLENPSSTQESSGFSNETPNSQSIQCLSDFDIFTFEQTGDETMPTASIQVGNISFTLILYDNASTQALLAQMPLTINMSELNGNEKYYYLLDSLPTDSQQVGNIHTGDLMLYGSSCLVLFYESFSTSYSYTKLGYIEDASGLANALGRGSVDITFCID